ncbi:MAG: amidase family protein [Acidimicrobiales bacterium]
MAEFMNGKTTSVALTEHLLEQQESYLDLNMFIWIDENRALEAAHLADLHRDHSPLHGLPIAVKDNIHAVGFANSAGTRCLHDFLPAEDAEMVSRLRAAGAFVLGKTNLHELAFGVTSANPIYGYVKNPSDHQRFAGGSSGGTAAAIASGSAIAGLGTDTGGSLRIPASLTGTAALRPTVGRYSTRGVTPLSPTRDTVGPMAKTVRDLEILDHVLVLEGSDTRVSSKGTDISLGVPDAFFADSLHPDTAAAWARALDMLERGGVQLLDVETPSFDVVESEIGRPISLFEAREWLLPYLQQATDLDVGAIIELIATPDVRRAFSELIRPGGRENYSLPRYQKAMSDRTSIVQAWYGKVFGDGTIQALIFPTTPCPAGRLDRDLETVDRGNGLRSPTFGTYIRNTCPGSVAGVPGISLPIPVAEGQLPVGLALDGAWGSDRLLLGIGKVLEELLVDGR